MIFLATGLLMREGRVLLVASTYPNHPNPLWNLPGGRQQHRELLTETVVREFAEETGLAVRPVDLAYVSESYAGNEHFLNATFNVKIVSGSPFDHRVTEKLQTRDHVVCARWAPISELAAQIAVAVVREPLLAHLGGELPQRFAGFHDAGVTIEWPVDSS